MTYSTIEPTPPVSGNSAVQHAESAARPGARRFTKLGAFTGAAALVVALAACGGDDDEPTETTVTTSAAPTLADPTTTVAEVVTTTAAPTTTLPELVTEGAIVVVANASRVNGGAGRLSDRLALATYTMGTPTDSNEGPLEVSKVYYNASVPEAQAVAESVRASLGGGAIELLELPTPAPVASGEIGDATVLVAMGNDIADVPLDVLQGVATTTTTTASGESEDSTPDDTAEETTTTAGA
ncbi:MAG TPA: LytR C-terminal domain-containing protein [Ilumatobacter sp.]|nr:LytR C-terminal domain-containing protein [Ilumatobacter sp.]